MNDGERALLCSKIKRLALTDKKYHLLLCCHQTIPKCSSIETSSDAWEYLKKRIVELNLSKHIYYTRSNCFQICFDGPIMVVYPDGTWYRACTPKVIERILQEHILQGLPVQEYLLLNKFLHSKNDCNLI